MRKFGCRAYIILLVCCIAVLMGFPGRVQCVSQAQSVGTKVHFIDVGQGDAIFIELPDGKTMLIDGGEEKYGKRVCKYISSLGYSQIDYMVATHSDADHIGGLKTVLNKLEVKEIYRPFTISLGAFDGFVDELALKFSGELSTLSTENSPLYAEFLSLCYSEECEQNLAKIHIATDQETIISDFAENPYMIKFFMPKGVRPFSSGRVDLGYTVEAQEDNNDTSAVIELITATSKFLFMGDLTKSGEEKLIQNLQPGERSMLANVTILKVGHHGSKESSSQALINLVKPTYAIISVGEDNLYGHPSAEVINRLTSSGAVVYSTQNLGTIIAKEQGSAIVVTNIETKSFFEKHTWVIYLIIGVVAAAIMVVITIFGIKLSKKQAIAIEKSGKPVDKNEIR